jgi:hypothetical protein
MARMGWLARATVMLTTWEARTPFTKGSLTAGWSEPVTSERTTVPLNPAATLPKAS